MKGRTNEEGISPPATADPATVHMATRSRKGYWWMSQNEIVRYALNNRWLEEQGVPDLRAICMVLHYGSKARV